MSANVRDELIHLLRTDPEVQELVRPADELRREMAALVQEVKRLAEAQSRLAEAQSRTEHAVRSLARQVGGLSDKLGGSLEDLGIETVPAVLGEAWELEEVECGRDVLEVGGKEHELDLVLRARLPSGEAVAVLGEVKARLTGGEVDEFLETARAVTPALAPAEVRVLFFGFQCNYEARRKIRDAGAYMVFSNGRML